LTASKGHEDGFGLLKNLPAEQLELLANCDIRYSLPAQGLPAAAPAVAAAADLQRQLGLTAAPAAAASNMKQTSSSPKQPTVKPVAAKHLEVRTVPAANLTTVAASSSCQGSCSVSSSCLTAGVGGPDRLAYLRSCIRGEATLPAPHVMPGAASATTPGSYSHIFLRFFEDFVQITLAATGARLTGSLSPPGKRRVCLVHQLPVPVHLLSQICC
jgi:hypothetical protein